MRVLVVMIGQSKSQLERSEDLGAVYDNGNSGERLTCYSSSSLLRRAQSGRMVEAPEHVVAGLQAWRAVSVRDSVSIG